VGDADAEGNARAELLHTTCGTPNYVAPEVCMDIYVYLYVYICIYLYIYIYVFMYVNKYMGVNV
jgi:hypothetical protein